MTPEHHVFAGRAEVGEVVVQQLAGQLEVAVQRAAAGTAAAAAAAGAAAGAVAGSLAALVASAGGVGGAGGGGAVGAGGGAVRSAVALGDDVLVLGANLLHESLLHQIVDAICERKDARNIDWKCSSYIFSSYQGQSPARRRCAPPSTS